MGKIHKIVKVEDNSFVLPVTISDAIYMTKDSKILTKKFSINEFPIGTILEKNTILSFNQNYQDWYRCDGTSIIINNIEYPIPDSSIYYIHSPLGTTGNPA